jgi:hypothetical protein
LARGVKAEGCKTDVKQIDIKQGLCVKVFYSPTDAQVSCLKNIVKIYIKTAPTYFGAVTPSSVSVLFVLAKVTVVKTVN